MQIGVNYLKEVEELFEEGKIDFIDYFKLFSLNEDLSGMDWCVKNRWVMFHGTCGETSKYGDKNLVRDTDIEKTKQIIEISKTPYLSGHIFATDKNQTVEETEKTIKENLAEYRKMFGKDIALENIPGRDRYSPYLIDPDFIKKVIYENDAMFLFDISHARKSAEYMNMNFEEYISRLPMDRVVEIHLAGMYYFPNISDEETRKNYTNAQLEVIQELKTKYGGDSADIHSKMNEEDYEFLKEGIKKYKTLKYITLEYGSYISGNPKDEYYPIPLASYSRVNSKVKKEVLNQLTKIKEIVDKNE